MNGASAFLKLQRVGFSPEQADAIADVFDSQVVTKADLRQEVSGLRADLNQVESSLRADLEREVASLRAELKQQDISLRAELRLMDSNLRNDMRQMEQRITIRLGGMMVVGIGVLLAAMRMMLPH